MDALEGKGKVSRGGAEKRSGGAGKALGVLALLAALGVGGYHGWMKHEEALREKAAEVERIQAEVERQAAPSAEVKAFGDGRSFSSASVTTDYIVQRGDYFAKISKRFNVKLDDLRKANPQIKNDIVMIGQKIVIPGKVEVGEYTVPEGSLYKPYKRENMPYSGPTKDYTVKAGDSLAGIAYGNGINIRHLKELNGLASDVLRVGQRLKIPAGQQHHGTGVALLDDLSGDGGNNSISEWGML